jgi:hypothetical protein
MRAKGEEEEGRRDLIVLFIGFLRYECYRGLPHVVDPLSETCLWVLSILSVEIVKPLSEQASNALAEDPFWNISLFCKPDSCLHVNLIV